MDGLALQIDGKWAVLDEDVSISIEENSPIWGEGNSFSFPFELDVEANRHIIGNSDQITGESIYKTLEGQVAVLYVMGVPLYHGKISLEDEVEIAEGRVEVTLISGNLTFDEMIEGMNCQDVPLKDEILVGEGIDYMNARDYLSNEIKTIYFPREIMRMQVGGISTVNVSNAYPIAKYCNVRIAYQLPEPPEQQQYNSFLDNIVNDQTYFNQLNISKGDFASYVILDADRPLSGLCFFVLYFLDCLFAKLNIVFDSSSLTSIEDMNRLAFFSTRCSCTLKDSNIYYSTAKEIIEIYPSFFWYGNGGLSNYRYHYCQYVADSKNFPNTDVNKVVNSLKNGFGVRFLHNTRINKTTAIFIKDILKDSTVYTIGNATIFEAVKVENNIKGLRLQYSDTDEENTSFSYSEWDNIDTTKVYSEIIEEVYASNRTAYLDNKTGDAYRIKVDDEAKTEWELNPTLVEVAEYVPVLYGDCSSENNTESIEIPFTPIIQNDVQKNGETGSQTFATFMNLGMKYPSYIPWVSYNTPWDYDSRNPNKGDSYKYTYFSAQQSSDPATKMFLAWGSNDLKSIDENALFDYDAGLMFGVMRGPGSNANIQEFDENYDGEGGSKYVTVPADYAFHNDTMDNYGNVFDYNGQMDGGVDISGRFSLKLKAEKPIPNSLKELDTTYDEFYTKWKEWGLSDTEIQSKWSEKLNNVEYYKNHDYFPITEAYAQKRGLFDKFHTEYAYWVVNRKIVRMTLRMELADLVDMDWTKRYKIGDYVGFVNKYSYTVNNTGMSDVTLEMYYL